MFPRGFIAWTQLIESTKQISLIFFKLHVEQKQKNPRWRTSHSRFNFVYFYAKKLCNTSFYRFQTSTISFLGVIFSPNDNLLRYHLRLEIACKTFALNSLFLWNQCCFKRTTVILLKEQSQIKRKSQFRRTHHVFCQVQNGRQNNRRLFLGVVK